MSEELERFLRRMDQDMLVCGESAYHAEINPQGEPEIVRIDPTTYIIPEMGSGLEAQINNAIRYEYNSSLTEHDLRRYMQELVQHNINRQLETILYHGTPTYAYEYNAGVDGTLQDIKSRRATTHKSPIHNYNIREDRTSIAENDTITLSVKTPTREYKIECTKLDYQLRLTQAKGGAFKNWEYGK